MPKPYVPVSVIIPAYLAGVTIVRAIRSVAEQTLRPLELIVVDDASTDDTREHVRAIAQDFEPGWLRLMVLQQNVGAASARNAGWDVARGDYVAFLDADDTWHPEKIELQFSYMQSHPEVVLCGHDFAFDSSASAVRLPVHARRIGKFRILLTNPFVTPSVMLRCALTKRFQSGKRYMEDHFLLMEVILAGGKVVKLNAKLAYLHKAQFGDGGLSASLWEMEKGELDNYRQLSANGIISSPVASVFMTYSLLKFVKRLLVIGWRRLKAT